MTLSEFRITEREFRENAGLRAKWAELLNDPSGVVPLALRVVQSMGMASRLSAEAKMENAVSAYYMQQGFMMAVNHLLNLAEPMPTEEKAATVQSLVGKIPLEKLPEELRYRDENKNPAPPPPKHPLNPQTAQRFAAMAAATQVPAPTE